MRFINDDDDVFKSEVHRFETRFPYAVIEEVIVIANKDVGTADRLPGRFPRAGLSRFAVRGVGPCDVDQFINMEGRSKNAFFETGGSGDPRFARASFSGLAAQQREYERGFLGKGLDAHACLAHHVHQTNRHHALSAVVDSPNGVYDDAMLCLS